MHNRAGRPGHRPHRIGMATDIHHEPWRYMAMANRPEAVESVQETGMMGIFFVALARGSGAAAAARWFSSPRV